MALNPTSVMTKIIDWAAEVRKAWGPEWSEPDVAYQFSNDRKFKSTDGAGGGIYDVDVP